MKFCIERATGASRMVPDDYVPTVQEMCKPFEGAEPEPEPEEEPEEEEEE